MPSRPDAPKPSGNTTSTADWLAELQRPETYAADAGTEVTLHETHISWVFLCGDDAYKLKKPIKNDFLDYSTLSKREAYCQEEIRLNRRYIEGLYLEVVAVTQEQDGLRINGEGPVLDDAVRMKRFSEDALLSQHLREDTVTSDEIRQLAKTVADFHIDAERVESGQPFGTPEVVLQNAMANFATLSDAPVEHLEESLMGLSQWTRQVHEADREAFARRHRDGFVRECHGDLHSSNVIAWRGRFVPFDGIEFNSAFRWIDVLADVAFLGMDLVAEGHLDLSRSFLSSYLEQTGDYDSLELYRFYAVYRALVRAKVAAIRAGQEGLSEVERQAALVDCREHVDLTHEWTRPVQPSLWITHGVSGSGKSTGSEIIVQRKGAIRIRSDVERKRMLGPVEASDSGSLPGGSIYSEKSTRLTYQRLEFLARQLLRSGYPVLVDATFLKRAQRNAFASLAKSMGASFHILHFDADDAVLRERIRQRASQQNNVSDADLSVLEQQQRTMEPLTEAEKQRRIEMPSKITVIDSL